MLSYNSADLCVDNLWVIPKHFFTPDLVEKRKPLSNNARRADWVGCNIIFDQIPEQGRIIIIHNRTTINKDDVVSQVYRSTLLSTNNIDARGWLLDVLNCINQISTDVFNLDEIYQFDTYLWLRHPMNNNIRPKTRQQLQLLRDKEFIEFVWRGVYRKRM